MEIKHRALEEIANIQENAWILGQKIHQQNIGEMKKTVDVINNMSLENTKQMTEKDPLSQKEIRVVENAFRQLLPAIFEEQIYKQQKASEEFGLSLERLRQRIEKIS